MQPGIHSSSAECSTWPSWPWSPTRTATATTSSAGSAAPASSDVGDASVYGTLRRLYGAGALTSYVVASEEGPHRKYYGITTAGRSELKRQAEDWHSFSSTITSLIDAEEAVA